MKIAVVASGWHFPLHFYKQIAAQKLPEGWSAELFCISHREPHYSAQEKISILAQLGWSYRETLDRIFYEKIASIDEIEALGWKYILEPNTIGDMGNVNQWLEKNDYKNYDMILITHDDNLILNDRLYTDLLVGELPWLILTNSVGSYPISTRDWFASIGKPIPIRGSFEFFKPEVFEMMGGKFDLSGITLTRDGETHSDMDLDTLRDWNNTTRPLVNLFESKGLHKRIKALSPYYRMSEYCLEGERGFISKSAENNKRNKVREDKGLARIQKIYDTALFPWQDGNRTA